MITSSRFRRLCAALRGRSGTTAVEFALIAPVLFALLTGVFEISRFFYVRSSLQKAVDDAGRYAMRTTTATDQELTDIAKQDLISSVSAATTFQIVRETDSGTDFLTFSVAYTFTPVASIVPFGNISVNLQARVPLID